MAVLEPPRNLKTILDFHLKDETLWPRQVDGKLVTKCNIFIQRVCTDMDYAKFNEPPPWGKTANQIFDHCEAADEWVSIGMNDSLYYAQQNKVVLAAQKGSPHGHVAVVVPDKLTVFSGKWNIYVPIVAQAGKTIGKMGLNYAFSEIPKFFLLRL